MTRFHVWARWSSAVVCGLLLASCAETRFIVHTVKKIGKVQEAPAVRKEGIYKVGNPYRINTVWYRPRVDYDYKETGIASWYGSKFHGRPTANGEIYDMNALTAAHRTLPMPSYVRVINLENGRSINLKVNDRGPFAHNRIIDVSRRGAQLLGFYMKGTARVRVEILANESRALANRLIGRAKFAAVDTPITVTRLPKPTVSSEALPPPPGASVTSPPAETAALPAPPDNRAVAATASLEPKLGVVTMQPVQSTRLFVQAGAFSVYENANRVRAVLNTLGPIKISQVLVDGKDLYRVRVGPLNSVVQADQMLEWVIQRGYANSRIIVD